MASGSKLRIHGTFVRGCRLQHASTASGGIRTCFAPHGCRLDTLAEWYSRAIHAMSTEVDARTRQQTISEVFDWEIPPPPFAFSLFFFHFFRSRPVAASIPSRPFPPLHSCTPCRLPPPRHGDCGIGASARGCRRAPATATAVRRHQPQRLVSALRVPAVSQANSAGRQRAHIARDDRRVRRGLHARTQGGPTQRRSVRRGSAGRVVRAAAGQSTGGQCRAATAAVGDLGQLARSATAGSGRRREQREFVRRQCSRCRCRCRRLVQRGHRRPDQLPPAGRIGQPRARDRHGKMPRRRAAMRTLRAPRLCGTRSATDGDGEGQHRRDEPSAAQTHAAGQDGAGRNASWPNASWSATRVAAPSVGTMLLVAAAVY